MRKRWITERDLKAFAAHLLHEEKSAAMREKYMRDIRRFYAFLNGRALRKDNTSGYTGVQFNKRSGKWQALITFKGKRYNLGRFDKIEDAAEARKEAENRIFGEFLDWYYEQYPEHRPESVQEQAAPKKRPQSRRRPAKRVAASAEV